MSGALELINELGDELSKPYIVASDLPLELGRHYLETHHRLNPLRRYCGEWFVYNGRAYEVMPDEALRVAIYKHLERLWRASKEDKLCRLLVNARLVSNVLDALPACETLLSGIIPQWTDDRPSAEEYLALESGLLHLPTRTQHKHDPAFFTTTALPYSYDPTAPPPERWWTFLKSLWNDDEQSINALQEWFGLMLTGDMRYQKILLIVGPKRAGKDTIARVMEAMIGADNCCALTMGTLAGPFGMQSIIGKRLAIFSDARISGRVDSAIVVDRLLSLSGGGLQGIPRKHKADWTGRPETRMTILSNELPNLADASGALPSRMLLLQLHESFYGREDHDLQKDLLLAMPGILNWALDGLDRLTARKKFIARKDAEEVMEQLTDLGSPVSAFVRECCEVPSVIATPCATLHTRWQEWCAKQGMTSVSNQAVFGRDLLAAFPSCKKKQYRSGGGRRENSYSNIRIL